MGFAGTCLGAGITPATSLLHVAECQTRSNQAAVHASAPLRTHCLAGRCDETYQHLQQQQAEAVRTATPTQHFQQGSTLKPRQHPFNSAEGMYRKCTVTGRNPYLRCGFATQRPQTILQPRRHCQASARRQPSTRQAGPACSPRAQDSSGWYWQLATTQKRQLAKHSRRAQGSKPLRLWCGGCCCARVGSRHRKQQGIQQGNRCNTTQHLRQDGMVEPRQYPLKQCGRSTQEAFGDRVTNPVCAAGITRSQRP